MARPLKLRLDQRLLELYPCLTRNQAQGWIMRGCVTVDGRVVDKPGVAVPVTAEILLVPDTPQYVSRAGYKLAAVLDHFSITLAGKVILDAGISTGGFTDCMLQRGAAMVYGVDVGYNLVHESVRRDPRVQLFERTNLRHLEGLPQLVDLVTLDLSFISVTKVLDRVIALMKPVSELIILVKPQFEAGRTDVPRGGIITDPIVHQQVIAMVSSAVTDRAFTVVGYIPSPLLGTSGNQEFLLYAQRGSTHNS